MTSDNNPVLAPDATARMDRLFEEFLDPLRAYLGEVIDLASMAATGKLPTHRAITLEQFDARADAAAMRADRVYAARRAATAERKAHS